MTEVFERTPMARMESLALANEIRFYRSRLKRRLTLELACEVIAEPPAETATMKVLVLLGAIPYWGPVRAHRALRECGVSHGKTLAGLSARQRAALIEFLRQVNDRPRRLTLSGSAAEGRQEIG